MDTNTHVAWDFGVIDDVLPLRDDNPDRRTKTLCGKRVPITRIDNDEPTCAACLSELRETERVARLLEAREVRHG